MGVADKIARVMKDVDRIPKRGRNPHFKYDYVTEADLVDHLRPLMATIGLVMIPSQHERFEREVETRSGTSTVAAIHHTFLFVDTEDDSHLEVRVWGEGQDTGDKASYKAFTGAVKYALMKTFLVSTGDDPEASSHEPAPEQTPVDFRQDAEGVEPVMELLDEPIRFGKHKGETWAEVLQSDRGYAKWAVDSAKNMGADLRATLMAALAEPVDTASSVGEVPVDGTTTGPPAEPGQLAALRVAFGAIAIECDDTTREHVESVLALDEPTEREVMQLVEYCENIRRTLDIEKEA